MNKKLIWGVIALVLIILVVWNVHNKQTGGKETIKIGLIAPLTGPGAVFGNAIAKAIVLAQQDLKNTKYDYKVIIENDETTPAKSASAAQKLINIDKVQAIISMTSGTGNAVAPIADSAHVIHICTCTDTRVGYGKYNFTNLVMPDDEGLVYVNEAIKEGVKKIAIMSQNHPGVNAIVDATRKIALEKGLSVVMDEKFEGSNRDFKTIAAKAKTIKADTYYVVAFPPGLDILGKELKDNSVKPVSASATFGIASDLKVFEGDWSTDGSTSDEFKARFEKEFPDVRFNVRSAPYGYDSFMLLVKGFESGTPDIASYVGSTTSFEGVAGLTTRVGNNFRSPASLWVVKDGKLVRKQ